MKTIFKLYVRNTLNIELIKASVNEIELVSEEKLAYSLSRQGIPYLLELTPEYLGGIIEEDYEKKQFPIITNAIQGKMITFSGLFLSNYGFNYANTPMWYLTLKIRKVLEFHKHEEIFEILTNILGGYWAKLSPLEIEGKFFRQSQPDYNSELESGLPQLPFDPPLDSPYIPSKLGWLNYWPAPALKRINFQEQHRALFHSVQLVANDGLILQITKDPLDLDDSEHLRKTVAIYDALPAIGGRDCVSILSD